jgi:hypothetical protein
VYSAEFALVLVVVDKGQGHRFFGSGGSLGVCAKRFALLGLRALSVSVMFVVDFEVSESVSN